jgi:nucleoid DNA-binding protein
MTRSAIVKALREQTGLSGRASAAALGAFLKAIAGSLAAGGVVRIRNFGRFEAVARKARTARLPRGGGLTRLAAKRVVCFRSSKRLKAQVNDSPEDLCAWPVELEQLHDSLVTSEGLEAMLAGHRQWLASGGKRGVRAQMNRGDLRRASLEEADLRQAGFACARLSQAELTNADLDDADLESAVLDDACLCWASLRRANLRRASLRGADLRWADFQGADLREADLSNALLSGADFREAALAGAELGGASIEKGRIEAGDDSLAGRFKKQCARRRFFKF